MFNKLTTTLLVGALSVSAEPGKCHEDNENFLDEECYCELGEVMNEDFSGCEKPGRRLFQDYDGGAYEVYETEE